MSRGIGYGVNLDVVKLHGLGIVTTIVVSFYPVSSSLSVSILYTRRMEGVIELCKKYSRFTIHSSRVCLYLFFSV